MNKKILFKTPVDVFKEALPLGNGTIGAMIFGSAEDRIALNHELLYTGEFREKSPREVNQEDLKVIRKLILNGEIGKATYLANQYLDEYGARSPIWTRVDPYQPVGDIYVKEGTDTDTPMNDYERFLDLDEAKVITTFNKNDINFRREYCTLHSKNKNNKKLSLIFSASKPTDYYFRISRIAETGQTEEERRCIRCMVTPRRTDHSTLFYGDFRGGVRFVTEMTVRKTDGEVRYLDGKIEIKNATHIWILTDIEVTYDGSIPRSVFPDLTLEELYADHKKTYTDVYAKCSLELPGDLEKENLPTPERIAGYKESGGTSDPTIPVLYFNYGRYLLISSCGELPPHLQGIWNDELRPAWEADFHLDINLQMNYWPAEPTGLGEYTNALFNWCERFIESGAKAAKNYYNCRGIWMPLCTDAWGKSVSDSTGWGVWIGAAPWFCEHYWMHYEYSGDKEFLKNRAYPFIKLNAQFIEDYLTEDKDGNLCIVPSQSPENHALYEGREEKGHKILDIPALVGENVSEYRGEFDDYYGEMPVTITKNCAMDITFFTQVLEYAVQASKILNIDEEERLIWEKLLNRMPKLKTGSYGQILEWDEEYPEKEPGHRHFSPTIGVFPTDFITEEETPELFEGCKKLLEHRLAAGGGHTGWSRSWTSCLYARFGNGNEAYKHMTALIVDFATASLLDLHPPRIFQIDGNFGGTAAIAEMLLQSYRYRIDILPALPDCWKEGSFKGLRARGNFEISANWADNKLSNATIIAHNGGTCKLKKKNMDLTIMINGSIITPTVINGLYVFETNKGDVIKISNK